MPENSPSPWFSSVRMVPTTTATMADRRSIGRWRGPHREHLMVPATVGSAPGGRKRKVRPARVARPQFWQVAASVLLCWAVSSDCCKSLTISGEVREF